jgi:hypothetical protein
MIRDVLDLPSHDVIMGELIQTYVDDTAMTTAKVDISKLQPLLFDMASKKDWFLGPTVGTCWKDGKALKGK